VRVLFCGNGWFPLIDAINERRPNDEVTVWDRGTRLVDAVGATEVILPSNGTIDSDVIGAANSLRLIQQPASGYDGVDLEAALARKIPVCNAPGANTASVAETATYLMLALARRAKSAARAFEARTIGVPLGRELRGRTVGLIGFGSSGQAFGKIADGLGMTVLHVTSRSTATDLNELLAASDVVSLHCPLNPATREMVDESFIARMKRGAFLINCARGPVIARPALEAALADGHLAGAGLDTYWEEPWNPSDPLFQRPDVVTLPHVAGSSEESFARIADIVSENIRLVEAGLSPLHRVA